MNATMGSVIVAVIGLIATFLKLYMTYKSEQKKESDYETKKTEIDTAIKNSDIDTINTNVNELCDFEPESGNSDSSGQTDSPDK